MKILHYRHDREVGVIWAFLAWQLPLGSHAPEVEEDARALAQSLGTGVPLVFDNRGKRIARGFQELVKYWDREGLWLL